MADAASGANNEMVAAVPFPTLTAGDGDDADLSAASRYKVPDVWRELQAPQTSHGSNLFKPQEHVVNSVRHWIDF